MKGSASTGFRGLRFDLAQAIAACAGLRNRIVHEYDAIDPARSHGALQTAARDVPQYLTHIHGYLNRPPAEPTHRVPLFALQHPPLQ